MNPVRCDDCQMALGIPELDAYARTCIRCDQTFGRCCESLHALRRSLNREGQRKCQRYDKEARLQTRQWGAEHSTLGPATEWWLLYRSIVNRREAMLDAEQLSHKDLSAYDSIALGFSKLDSKGFPVTCTTCRSLEPCLRRHLQWVIWIARNQ